MIASTYIIQTIGVTLDIISSHQPRTTTASVCTTFTFGPDITPSTWHIVDTLPLQAAACSGSGRPGQVTERSGAMDLTVRLLQIRDHARLRMIKYENPDPDCVLFFQAEAGIRDLTVTGVQTCALPI